MVTYVLIHGAGDVAWYWHLLAAELRERGHEAVAMDLPADDDAAGLAVYADAVVAAIGDRTSSDLVVVGHSFGGYTAPLVCAKVPVKLLVLVAGIYVGFALQDGRVAVLAIEAAVAGAFVGLWVSAWAVPVAYVLHGFWDVAHHRHVATAMPTWYIPFCAVFD